MTKPFTPEDAAKFAEEALQTGTTLVATMATDASKLVKPTPPSLSAVKESLIKSAEPLVPDPAPDPEVITKNLLQMATELGQTVLDAIVKVINDALSKTPPEVPNPADAIGPITDGIKTSIGFPP